MSAPRPAAGMGAPAPLTPKLVMAHHSRHASAVGIPELDYRARFVRFYEKYNPEKLPEVDSLLTKFHYDLPGVIAAMQRKYGPEPGPVIPAGTPLAAPASQPQQGSNNGPQSPSHAAGRPVAAASTPLSPGRPLGAQPQKLAAAPGTSAGSAPGAGPPVKVVHAASPSFSVPIPEGNYRARMQRFYAKYAPDKVGEVDGLMAKYQSDLPRVIEAMRTKYGPEPGPVLAVGSAATHITPAASAGFHPQPTVVPANGAGQPAAAGSNAAAVAPHHPRGKSFSAAPTVISAGTGAPGAAPTSSAAAAARSVVF